ncbi:MAG: alpha-galactosidase [Lachnospiraceae bacterium]|nr:alpha-galactosidase [Lachnospiraceae bacterium]
MEQYVELRLQNDAFGGGYSAGLTMCGGQSSAELKKVSEAGENIIFEDNRKHRITLHRKTEGDVVFFSTTFHNEGEESAVLEMLSSFALKGVEADTFYRMQSFWSAEGKLRKESIYDLHLEHSWSGNGYRVEKFGNVGSMPVRKYFPFLVLENSKTGEFIGIQLYSPSSWQMELIVTGRENTVTVVGGIADRDFGHWKKTIAPGESFTTPKAAVAFGDSIYDVCDKLVKAQKPDSSPIDCQMGIMFNEYCTTWGNPSLENIKNMCDKLKDKGLQYFVMDSGWYGNAKYWWTCVGDWDINETKFPGGLKPMADYVRQCGMIPGIWFEFESVGTGSKYYNATEHLLKRDGVPLTVGEHRFFDMSDPWVVDYLSEKVIKLLKDCGFGYIKVDYNDTIGVGCDDADGLGEGLRKYVLASQAFFRKIKEELPDIVIENCSSGGHRLEPSMMALASQASFSDAHETTSIPVIAANLHRVIRPEQSQIWAVLRKEDSITRLQYSLINTLLGRMCISGDIYELSDEQWACIEEGMEFYRRAADIIKDGKTVLVDCDTESYLKPTGEQLVIRQLGNQYLAIAHRFENSKAVSEDFLDGATVTATYGELSGDFSAKAWIYEK